MIHPPTYDEYVSRLPFLGRITCDASELVAGSWHELKLLYEVGASGLADGAWIKLTFRFYSDWGLFQTEDPTAPNYVSAELLAREALPGETQQPLPVIKLRFDQKGHERPFQKALLVDIVDGYLRPGDRIAFRLGDRRGGSPGTRVQTFVDDDFRFRAYIDPVGTSRFAAIPGDVILNIIPGEAAAVRVHTPRLVKTGTTFPLTIVAEDVWGNACRPAGVQFELAMDETTRTLACDNNRWASAKFSMSIDRSGETAIVAALAGRPISTTAFVSADASLPFDRPFFADLHVHSSNTVGTNSTEYNFAYGRDVAGLDVLGYTANDFNITEARWNADAALCREFTKHGVYLCFAGIEWNGNSSAGGDRNVIFLGDTTPFPNDRGQSVRSFEWNEDMRGSTIAAGAWPVDRLHAAYHDRAEQILMIPHVGGRRCNLDWFDPELERLIEVASAWGHFPWFYQDAIERGYRVGASAAGDEHRGRPGGGAPGVDVFGTRGGLTGIFAPDLSKAAIGRALRNRHTWATTGDRSVALLSAGMARQGDVTKVAGPVELNYRLLGSAGWEYIAAFTNRGLLWERDLHREAGYSPTRVRVRWGGARVKDRYRWARWSGSVRCTGATLVDTIGFEHLEEWAKRTGDDTFEIKSETYGDADGIILDVPHLATATFEMDLLIQSYAKTGSPLSRSPFTACPAVRWAVAGKELLRDGAVRKDLPGVEMFVSIERVTTDPLPRDVADRFIVDPIANGITAVYVTARETNDAKVWTSPIFFE